jgi:tetratricopeptide (TPR) repeat protein
VQQLLEHSADALGDGLAGQPVVRAELRQIVGGLLSDLEINGAAIRLQRRQAEDLAARGAPAAEQVRAWRALGQSLFRDSDLKTAREVLARTNSACAAPRGDELAALCLGVALDRALIDKTQGKLDAAQAAAEPLPEALARHPAAANDLADAYELLAQIRDLRNQPDEARAFFEQALALRREQWGEGSVRLAQMRYRFGRMLWNLRRLAQAEQEMTAAWLATRAALGAEHVASARNELHLGRLQFYVGTSDEGMTHLRHAHAVLLSQADRLDPQELLTARSFLANALVLDGRWAEAGPALDAAEQARASPGRNGGSGVTLDLSRALWLAGVGRLPEALAMHRRLRDDTIAQLGPRHPYVAERRHRVARVLLASGDTAGAERELQAALDTDDGVETVFGSAKHRVRIAQVLVAVAQRRASEAAAQADELLSLAARTDRRETYRETLALLHDAAARAYEAAGRTADARVQRARLGELAAA